MKIQLSGYRIYIYGALLPLWEIVESQPNSSPCSLIYPKLGVYGVLRNVVNNVVPFAQTVNIATGKVDTSGQDPPCGVINIDITWKKEGTGQLSLIEDLVPAGFRKEPNTVVQTPDGIRVTRSVFIGDRLDLAASDRMDLGT